MGKVCQKTPHPPTNPLPLDLGAEESRAVFAKLVDAAIGAEVELPGGMQEAMPGATRLGPYGGPLQNGRCAVRRRSCGGGVIQVWDMAMLQWKRSLDGHRRTVRAMMVHAGWLISESDDDRICVTQTACGTLGRASGSQTFSAMAGGAARWPSRPLGAERAQPAPSWPGAGDGGVGAVVLYDDEV